TIAQRRNALGEIERPGRSAGVLVVNQSFSFRGSRNAGDPSFHTFDIAQEFRVDEEKMPLAEDRPTQAAPKLILPYLAAREASPIIERVIGIERVVPKELINGPMKLVGPTAGHDIDRRTHRAAEFRFRQRLQLELLGCFI